jgi:hypothetical protein
MESTTFMAVFKMVDWTIFQCILKKIKKNQNTEIPANQSHDRRAINARFDWMGERLAGQDPRPGGLPKHLHY